MGLPDPLRRIHVPRDLDSVTDIGPEDPPEAGGVSARRVESIWRSARAWYRSGVHPAMQVCVRRNGAVILNRAIGHSRGNGPRDGKDAVRVPVTVDTPLDQLHEFNAIAWATGRIRIERVVVAGALLDIAGVFLIVGVVWGITAFV